MFEKERNPTPLVSVECSLRVHNKDNILGLHLIAVKISCFFFLLKQSCLSIVSFCNYNIYFGAAADDDDDNEDGDDDDEDDDEEDDEYGDDNEDGDDDDGEGG